MLKQSFRINSLGKTGIWNLRVFLNAYIFKAKDNRIAEENELLQLQKELKQLRMENDILKQAALIMGRK